MDPQSCPRSLDTIKHVQEQSRQESWADQSQLTLERFSKGVKMLRTTNRRKHFSRLKHETTFVSWNRDSWSWRLDLLRGWSICLDLLLSSS